MLDHFGSAAVPQLVYWLNRQANALAIIVSAKPPAARKRLLERACAALSDELTLPFIDALGIYDEKTFVILARLIGNPKPSTSEWALRLLQEHWNEKIRLAVPEIVRHFEASDSSSKRNLLRLFERIAPSAVGALPALRETLRDSDPEVRYRDVRVLEQMGPAASPALPELRAALNDPNPMVVTVTRRLLARIEPSAVGRAHSTNAPAR